MSHSIESYTFDRLTVRIFPDAASSGRAAAHDGADYIRSRLAAGKTVNAIFAAAPSQDETLRALSLEPDIDWSRVRAFHMDEYVGFARTKAQSFGHYLDEHIFGRVPFGEVYYLDADHSDACIRYAELMTKYPPDIVFLGIGENAHIAFNDPGVADFEDPELIKQVPLDEVCRMQQVHDGCFPTIAEVPTHAYTLTIPALMRAEKLICTVPRRTKADAVLATATGSIGAEIPATAMRLHRDAVMYCDEDSGRRLSEYMKGNEK